MRTALLLLVFLFFLAIPAAAKADTLAPWEFNSGAKKAGTAEGQNMSPGAKLLTLGLQFYRETISYVDGERCKMYPSCSAYAVEAVRKHGFFTGYVMTADRLIHESNEMDNAPKITLKNGKERYYDPVDANDFWWAGKAEK